MSTAMMAMTTSNSISVKARRMADLRGGGRVRGSYPYLRRSAGLGQEFRTLGVRDELPADYRGDPKAVVTRRYAPTPATTTATARRAVPGSGTGEKITP